MLRSNAEEIIRKTMARFVDTELIPQAQEIDEKGEFPWEMFHKMGQMGVFGIRYPKNRGGSGGNTTLYCIICEELARGLVGVAAVTAMQCLMEPISYFIMAPMNCARSISCLPCGVRKWPVFVSQNLKQVQTSGTLALWQQKRMKDTLLMA